MVRKLGENAPKLKFGRKVDNDVLNLNPRIGGEIVLRFPKNPRWRPNGRLTHFFGMSVDNDVLNLNRRSGENNLMRFPKNPK